MTYRPDPETVGKIKMAASFGVPVKKIASYVGMSENTLRKYHADILENAKTDRILAVANSLYQQALNGNVTAAIFYLKVQADQGTWSEKTQLINADGDAIQKVEIVIAEPKKKKDIEAVIASKKLDESNHTVM